MVAMVAIIAPLMPAPAMMMRFTCSASVQASETLQ